MSHTPIYTAIDTDNLENARTLSKAANNAGCGIKLGMEFYNTFGPQGVRTIMQDCPDAQIFMDLKFHDIPNTVAKAVKTVSEKLKPAYVNVHASGGLEMMQRAKEACDPATKLLAVTILTSMNEEQREAIGYNDTIPNQVKRLALLTKEAGLDGVVCSALEIAIIREACGPDFITMVPGIRPAGSKTQDQKRVMTPAQAIKQGATHLVIGRPITQADDPGQAASAIMAEIQ